MSEAWRPVPAWEGLYEVSNLGRVRSLPREYFGRGGRRIAPGGVLKLDIARTGYAQVSLARFTRKEKALVHRLVARAFLGEPGPGQEVCHGDGVRTNNVLANLRWDTHPANILDSVRQGTQAMVRKTHCPRGHELVGPNLKLRHLDNPRRVWRQCLACAVARDRKRPAGLTFAAHADLIYTDLFASVPR